MTLFHCKNKKKNHRHKRVALTESIQNETSFLSEKLYGSRTDLRLSLKYVNISNSADGILGLLKRLERFHYLS